MPLGFFKPKTKKLLKKNIRHHFNKDYVKFSIKKYNKKNKG